MLDEAVVHLLPTPRAMDGHASMVAPAARQHVADGNGSLPEVLGVELLPTPRARDGKGRDPNPRGHDLNHAVTLLPTPRATDGTNGGPNQRGSAVDRMLPSAVLLLPTPSAADAAGGRQARKTPRPGSPGGEQLLPGIVKNLPSGDGGNPPSDAGNTSPDQPLTLWNWDGPGIDG